MFLKFPYSTPKSNREFQTISMSKAWDTGEKRVCLMNRNSKRALGRSSCSPPELIRIYFHSCCLIKKSKALHVHAYSHTPSIMSVKKLGYWKYAACRCHVTLSVATRFRTIVRSNDNLTQRKGFGKSLFWGI